MKASQLGAYLETLNKGRPFFALTQAGRGSGLKSSLDRETERLRKAGNPDFVGIKSWDVVTLNEESAYFAMVKATPVTETVTPPPSAEDVDEGVVEKGADTPPAM